MPVSTEPTTFDYACNWLTSSDTFCRDAMGATAADDDSMRDQARACIYEEEALDIENEDEEGSTAPDAPPSICPRPRTIVRTQSDERKEVGTATFAGNGSLLIGVEVLVPEAYQQDEDLPLADQAASFKARKEWARRLCQTIRNELLAKKGLGDAQGNAYLNATTVNVQQQPADPDPLEGGDSANWMGWTYEVIWKG